MNASKWIRPLLLFMCMSIGTLGVWTSPPEAGQQRPETAPGPAVPPEAAGLKKALITADHSKYEVLQQNFKSGPDITRACVSCHYNAAAQVENTIHWNWIDPNSDNNTLTGKAGHSVNNFCISSNRMKDEKCLSCHPGWNGKTAGINCLMCHGQQEFNFAEAFEDYHFFCDSDDAESKFLAQQIQENIRETVQNVARPTRRNCGFCHFNGGGGDGSKHGDLDSSLLHPARPLDVHMNSGGQNFQCVRCHTTVSHHIAGRIYSTPAATSRKSLIQDDLITKITCESCHSDKPHPSGHKANDHTDIVACQSCHIPKYARVNPTKMWWDWSKAGKTKNGKPYITEGPLGKETYMSIKGDLRWEKNVTPQYLWFNGSINTLTTKDVIQPEDIVRVSWPLGDRRDPNSRIFPFKIHRGKQPYDTVNRTLLAPLLSGDQGYWKTFDWPKSLAIGMQYMDLPFSGKFDFVETSYVFPITHMVAPKETTVACTECHVRSQGRLANLSGFYMPGRDVFKPVALAGWLLVLGSLGGIVLHAAGRILTNGKKKET